ncbi:hypothetical protein F5887DRAFT_956305 [Amanita rubescens]|nr:hypothetical protein F5887DRAFT_956305 [Amanita rubescens]
MSYLLFSKVLGTFSDSLTFISKTKVHSRWFPYALAPTLHAARISAVYQHNARKAGYEKKLSWPTYLAGYLIMCWGGSVLSHLFLGLPSPTFYSIHLYINYIAPHLLFTLIFTLYPDLLNPRLLDTFLFPLDALLRTNTITATIGLLSNSGVNPVYASSPLAHMLLGAIASAGGGLSAATLKTWTPEWSLGTPPVLKEGAGIWGTVDVWGGALVALVYGIVTSHHAYSGFADTLGFAPGTIVFSPLGAKALGAVLLTVLFGLRVFFLHWIGQGTKSGPKKVKTR